MFICVFFLDEQLVHCMWLILLILTGRVEVGSTKALLAQWERKEKSRSVEKEKPAVVEKPVVVEKPSPQPRSYIAEKLFGDRSTSRDRDPPTASGGGVKTLGLDINSFVPVCFLKHLFSSLGAFVGLCYLSA